MGITGGQPIAPPVAVGFVILGLLLVSRGWFSKPIRQARGIGAKLRLLVSNYFQGPEDSGRVFWAGCALILIGIALTVMRHN